MLFAASVVVASLLYYQQDNDQRSINLIEMRETLQEKFAQQRPVSGKLVMGPDERNTTYYIANTSIDLTDGVFEREIADNVSQTTTIESSFNGDVNLDGTEDAVLLLKQTENDSSSFFIVVSFQNALSYFEGSNAVEIQNIAQFLSVEFEKNTIRVFYQDTEGNVNRMDISVQGKTLGKITTVPVENPEALSLDILPSEEELQIEMTEENMNEETPEEDVLTEEDPETILEEETPLTE